MKKGKIALLALLTCRVLAMAQSITVTSPAAEETWNAGSSHIIQWTKTGSQDAKVKIRLRLGGTAVLTIDDNAQNTGSYHWTVPVAQAGGKYTIRVRTIDGAVSGTSAKFNIFKPSKWTTGLGTPEPEIMITVSEPKKDAHFETGDVAKIRYQTKLAGPFQIQLYDQGGKTLIGEIETTTANPYYWQIPHNTPNVPGLFRIRIAAPDGANYGLSQKFRISMKLDKKNLVIQPHLENVVYKHPGDWSDDDPHYPLPTLAAPGQMLIGQQKTLKSFDRYMCHAHFNLQAHPRIVTILKAELKYVKISGPDCKTEVWVLKRPWNGMPEDLLNVRPADRIRANPVNFTASARDWLYGPATNYGIWFESGSYLNASLYDNCIAYYHQVELHLEVLEKLF